MRLMAEKAGVIAEELVRSGLRALTVRLVRD